jgi:hypothetical protein
MKDWDELPLVLVTEEIIGGAGVKELVLEVELEEVVFDVLLDVEAPVTVAVAVLLATLLGAGAKLILDIEAELEGAGAGAVVLELEPEEEEEEDGAEAALTLFAGLGALGPFKLAAAAAWMVARCAAFFALRLLEAEEELEEEAPLGILETIKTSLLLGIILSVGMCTSTLLHTYSELSILALLFFPTSSIAMNWEFPLLSWLLWFFSIGLSKGFWEGFSKGGRSGGFSWASALTLCDPALACAVKGLG